MAKCTLISFLFLFLFEAANAQRDTKVFYLKNSGKIVSTRDSADFIVNILPPDSSVDKKLFLVRVFYPNGKLMILGRSSTNSFALKLQGSYIAFFPNGHKKTIKNLQNGEPVGDVISYYPSGKLYNVKNYTPRKQVYFKQCNDSIGNVLTENGKGTWLAFNETFDKVDSSGQVNNGLQNGEWREKINDTTSLIRLYKNGIFISAAIMDNPAYLTVDPEFPGGYDAWKQFIGKYTRYPAIAWEKHTQGLVIIIFVVEKDGTLTNAKVIKGIGDACEQEAIRVILSSPAWKPGSINGQPARIVVKVPITFTLIDHTSAQVSIK